MKKILLFLLIVSSVLCLVSCGGDDNNNPPTEEFEKVHLVVLAGQSGARGKAKVGDLAPEDREKNEEVDIICDGMVMGALTNIPEEISDSLEIDSVRPGLGDDGSEFGPEIGIGQTLASCYPKEDADYKSVIVKYTASGSTLLDHWYSQSAVNDAELSQKLNLEQVRELEDGSSTGPLTSNLYQLVDYTIAYLEEEGFEVVIDGVAFVHGEQDAKFTQNMEIYEKALTYFIEDFRSYYEDSNMPFVITEALTNSAAYSNELRSIQAKVASEMNNVAFIKTTDLYSNTFEPWHFGAESNNVLGNRIAAEIISYNDSRSIDTIDEEEIVVPYGVSVELPQYVKATFTNEYSGYVKVEQYTKTYNPNTLGKQEVELKVNTKDGLVTQKLTVNVKNDVAFVDGVLSEYSNVKANVLPNNLGNVYVIKGEKGLYIAVDIKDNQIWTDGELWLKGDMGQKDNNDDFRVYLTTSDVSKRYTLCLSSANLLRIYSNGLSLNDVSATQAFAYNNLVYSKEVTDYKFHVTTKSMTNGIGDSVGMTMELYISYEELGITNPDDIKLCFNYNNVTGPLDNKTNVNNYLVKAVANNSIEEETIGCYFSISELI